MAIPDREDIHIISRHGQLSGTSVRNNLRDFVYSGKDAWQQFLKIFFLSLGAGFMLAGVIFFFAYNWDALHKFVKLGIIEGLIIILTITALIMRKNAIISKLLLTAASVIMGVLFAVFGQVYQTGADAYDLFLNWSFCIILWVIAAGFAPLWLIWLTLVNITILCWVRQRGIHISPMTTPLLLFLVNAVSLTLTLVLQHYKSRPVPWWFIIVVSLAAVTCSTMGVSVGIFERADLPFAILLLATVISYAGVLYYAFRQRIVFFIALTGFSIIFILCAAILHLADATTGSVLFICIFLGTTITLLIKGLLTLQKQWRHEKTT